MKDIDLRKNIINQRYETLISNERTDFDIVGSSNSSLSSAKDERAQTILERLSKSKNLLNSAQLSPEINDVSFGIEKEYALPHIKTAAERKNDLMSQITPSLLNLGEHNLETIRLKTRLNGEHEWKWKIPLRDNLVNVIRFLFYFETDDLD